ncbi:hypothetical protein Tco_0626545 [Tanacetum coccineum]|uniref:Uncharacterized protein n=1 Tax=Tanacetum coccineum TaxID=301880 RepID=A0ABQ4WK54_9ASTR
MQADISSIKVMVTEMFQAFKRISSSAPSGSAPVLTITQPKVDATVRGRGIHRSRWLFGTNLPLTLRGSNCKLSKLRLNTLKKSLKPESTPKPDRGKAKVVDVTPPKSDGSGTVVQEAVKVGVDPKILASAKGSQEFRKIQDAKIKVLNREHSEKIKRARELKKKRIDHLVYKGNDQRNFDVHKPFKFADFGVTELDELGPIIQKKKNKVVGELMTTLAKRYERLNKIPQKLGITLILLAPDVFGNEAFQRMSDIHKVGIETLLSYLVMHSNISTPANQRFCLTLKSLIESHHEKEKLKSKRVKLEAVGYILY